MDFAPDENRIEDVREKSESRDSDRSDMSSSWVCVKKETETSREQSESPCSKEYSSELNLLETGSQSSDLESDGISVISEPPYDKSDDEVPAQVESSDSNGVCSVSAEKCSCPDLENIEDKTVFSLEETNSSTEAVDNARAREAFFVNRPATLSSTNSMFLIAFILVLFSIPLHWYWGLPLTETYEPNINLNKEGYRNEILVNSLAYCSDIHKKDNNINREYSIKRCVKKINKIYKNIENQFKIDNGREKEDDTEDQVDIYDTDISIEDSESCNKNKNVNNRQNREFNKQKSKNNGKFKKEYEKLNKMKEALLRKEMHLKKKAEYLKYKAQELGEKEMKDELESSMESMTGSNGVDESKPEIKKNNGNLRNFADEAESESVLSENEEKGKIYKNKRENPQHKFSRDRIEKDDFQQKPQKHYKGDFDNLRFDRNSQNYDSGENKFAKNNRLNAYDQLNDKKHKVYNRKPRNKRQFDSFDSHKPGQWYSDWFEARSQLRKKNEKNEWLFDRARYRDGMRRLNFHFSRNTFTR